MKRFLGYQVKRRKLREERERLRGERKKLRKTRERLQRKQEKHRARLRDLRGERLQLQAERHYPLRTQVAHYRIEGLLSTVGTSARVYRARDVRDGREVAIKMARGELSEMDKEKFRASWQHASDMAARINHPHLMEIEPDEVDGQPYIAMPLAQGGDLETVVNREGALSPERTLRILGQVADAVDAVHARGLIHGDVWLDNILLAADDSAYLADSRPAGSDPRRDIYAFVRMLYACLGGPCVVAHFRGEAEREAKMDRHQFPSLDGVRCDIPALLERAMANVQALTLDHGPSTCTSLIDAVRAAVTTDQSDCAGSR